MESWEKELREQIGQEVSETKKNINTIKILYYIFFILGLCIVLSYDFKTNQFIWNGVKSVFSDKKQENDFLERKIDFVSQDLNDIRKELSLLGKETNENSSKIGLLGVMVNENFFIIKNNKDKNQILLFERNWDLNKKPVYLQLDDKDIEFLKGKIKQ